MVNSKRSYVHGESPKRFRLPSQRPYGFVRAWPQEASSDLKNSLTVTFNSHTNLIQGIHKGNEIFQEHGLCIYNNIRGVQSQLFTKYNEARKQLDNEYERRELSPKENLFLQFKSVFKGEQKGGKWNPGDGCKKIYMIHPGDRNSVASAMSSYMNEALGVIDPEQCVVQGQLHGECGDPVMQACLLADEEPKKGNRAEPQDEHIDAILFHTPTGDKSAEGMQHCNVTMVLKGGVNSWFFDMHGGYCLAVYPKMVKLSMACIQYFHDNVHSIRNTNQGLPENEMRDIIVDHIVQHLEKEFSDLQPESHAPVYLRCVEGDIIRLNSIVPHFGLPLHKEKKNTRGFLLTSKKVIQQVCSFKLPTTFLTRF